MFRSDRFHDTLRRMTVAVCTRALVLVLFLTAGVATATASEGTGTFTIAQTLDPTIRLGGSSQVVAAVGAVDGTGPVAGTVSFYACGPDGTVEGRCLAGAFFGSGTLDAKAQTVSPSFQPTSGGTWCFRAAYDGSAAYAASEATGACLQVGQVTSFTTLSGPAEWTEGTGATSTATVFGQPGGPTPTGAVAFAVCAVDTLQSTDCATPWSAVGTAMLDATGQTTSPAFLSDGLGTWCWEAAYGGDHSHVASKTTGACFTVAAAPGPDPEAPTPPEDPTAPDDGTGAAPAPERLGPGGWKHAVDWPVDTLLLGGEEYTEEQARALLDGPTKGDAGRILARHLIVAKLNQAAGAGGADAAAIGEADALLASLGGPDAGTNTSKGVGGQVGRMIAILEG